MDVFKRSVFFLFLSIGTTEAFNCYSCSYTYTGTDASYECVNAPWNVTQGSKTLPCAAPSKCSIDVTFEQDFGRILSAARSCRNPNGKTTECIDGSSRPSCHLFCGENLCNHKNVESMRPGEPGSATSVSVAYILFVFMLGMTLIFKY